MQVSSLGFLCVFDLPLGSSVSDFKTRKHATARHVVSKQVDVKVAIAAPRAPKMGISMMFVAALLKKAITEIFP